MHRWEYVAADSLCAERAQETCVVARAFPRNVTSGLKTREQLWTAHSLPAWQLSTSIEHAQSGRAGVPDHANFCVNLRPRQVLAPCVDNWASALTADVKGATRASVPHRLAFDGSSYKEAASLCAMKPFQHHLGTVLSSVSSAAKMTNARLHN